jgi:hypothetical protein
MAIPLIRQAAFVAALAVALCLSLFAVLEGVATLLREIRLGRDERDSLCDPGRIVP